MTAEVAKLKRQLAEQAGDLAILKKAADLLREESKVKAAFDASKQRDGARRIQAELADVGETAHLKTIADSMK